MIDDAGRARLHGYLAGVLKKIESPALIINSVPDHVHVLCAMSKNIAACKLVEEVKKSSSKWMKTQGVPTFAWQNGYGVLAVSQSNAAAVRKYIGNQQVHHRKLGFQEEFRRFLEKHRVQYDERYVWD